MHKLISAALGLTVLASLLAGCGDSDAEAGTQPTPSSSSSDASDASGDTAASDDAGDVEPATGPKLEFKHFTVRLPKGYTVADQLVDGIWQADREDQPIGIDQVSISDFPTFDASLEEAITAALKTTTLNLQHVKRYPDLDINGVTAFHVSADIRGGVTDGAVYELVGGTLEGSGKHPVPYGVGINWTMPASRSPKERLELLQSVIATWQWR